MIDMIDMREIKNDKDFIEAKKEFTKSFNNKKCEDITNCKWSKFKNSFLNFSKNKCPICEDTLNRYDDIDHFRPKKAGYEFLRCCCDNYMIMCSDCNRTHKKTSFPLLNDSLKANRKEDVKKEEALLVNPRTDNIFDFFQLFFITKGEKYILEVHPKNRDENSNEYKKAKETIKLYGIGFCSQNPKIDTCRINILEKHFEDFYPLAKARQKSKIKFLKLLKQMPKRAEYGFIKFIAKEQFKILSY